MLTIFRNKIARKSLNYKQFLDQKNTLTLMKSDYITGEKSEKGPYKMAKQIYKMKSKCLPLYPLQNIL